MAKNTSKAQKIRKWQVTYKAETGHVKTVSVEAPDIEGARKAASKLGAKREYISKVEQVSI